MHEELQQARSTIQRQSKLLTDKDCKISELIHAAETLKSDHATVQQQTLHQLTAAQGDAEVAKQDLTVVTLERDCVRQKLVTFGTSVASFSAKGGVIEVIRCICRHLTKLTREPGDSCDQHMVNTATELIAALWCVLTALDRTCQALTR